ncbi:hypothetical protein KC726_05630 [Candidatus Woesebacteria bacterium]|nr:hypothetical protein [Candidatus Woesebacteria bacterium]
MTEGAATSIPASVQTDMATQSHNAPAAPRTQVQVGEESPPPVEAQAEHEVETSSADTLAQPETSTDPAAEAEQAAIDTLTAVSNDQDADLGPELRAGLLMLVVGGGNPIESIEEIIKEKIQIPGQELTARQAALAQDLRIAAHQLKLNMLSREVETEGQNGKLVAEYKAVSAALDKLVADRKGGTLKIAEEGEGGNVKEIDISQEPNLIAQFAEDLGLEDVGDAPILAIHGAFVDAVNNKQARAELLEKVQNKLNPEDYQRFSQVLEAYAKQATSERVKGTASKMAVLTVLFLLISIWTSAKSSSPQQR